MYESTVLDSYDIVLGRKFMDTDQPSTNNASYSARQHHGAKETYSTEASSSDRSLPYCVQGHLCMILSLAEALAEVRDRRGVHKLTDRYYTVRVVRFQLESTPGTCVLSYSTAVQVRFKSPHIDFQLPYKATRPLGLYGRVGPLETHTTPCLLVAMRRT